MSQWTHVAAVIRYDKLRLTENDAPVLGNACFFDSPEEDWKKCDIPCGSEGSLHTLLWVNPNESHLASYTATIFGDLRDYDNVAEIVTYLNRITKGNFIRQGCATIDVEGEPTQTYIYHQDIEEWINA